MISLFVASCLLLILSFIPTYFVKNEVAHFILYLTKVGIAGWVTGGLFALAFI